MENQEKYTLEVFCKNCGFSGNAEIPKGTPYENYPCPTCGVANLGRSAKIIQMRPSFDVDDFR